MNPLLWPRIALRFITRSWRSTLALALMVFTAVGALVLLSSLAVGTNDAMIRNSVGLFSGEVACDALPPALDPAALAVEGVEAILIRRTQPLLLRGGQGMATVVLLGIDPTGERRWSALWRKVVAGRFPVAGEGVVLLSSELARDLGVGPGGHLEAILPDGASGGSLTVCGLYHTGVTALDRGLAIAPREALPVWAGRSAALFLRPGTVAPDVAEALRRLPGAPQFRAWSDFMPDLQQLVALNFVSMGIVMVLVFAVVALGIACAFVIFILKTLREHGILKAMGVLPLESAVLILAQVLLLTLAAALAGTAGGAAAVALLANSGIDLGAFTSHNPYFAVSGVIYPRLTAYSLMLPPALALLFGVLAAVWPSILVARARTADILRVL